MDFPETIEAVAFALLVLIMDGQEGPRTNKPLAAYTLDLYAECLRAARGEREGCAAERWETH